MKTITLVTSLLLYSLVALGQEEKQLGVFESDSIWLKEIIKFPIGFAPEINYEGYEDLRFATSWRDKDHPDFWSYTFVWHVKGIQKPTKEDIERELKSYYDGLMTAVNKKKDYTIPETTLSIMRTVSDTAANDYSGEINFYDSFITEKIITLNVRININYCETEQETMLIFKLSPQEFDHPIWQRFNEIKIRSGSCD